MTQRAIPCMFMRGGTSRGPFFLLEDLPADPEVRDRVLLAAMGSPDPRQIDGLGGATTMTSKVAMVSPSQRPAIDVDYHFAQVWLDKAIVDTAPSCGNMLAGVGPFAIERGLVTPDADETPGPHLRRQYRESNRGHRPDTGRDRDLCRRSAHRRGAGHRGAGGAQL